MGGAYDSTNIIHKPVVCGVAALGIDHVSVLGSTLGEIAWNKGGIFKHGVPAVSSEQPEEGLAVLQSRAVELGVRTRAVSRNHFIRMRGLWPKTNTHLSSPYSRPRFR